jgi:DNA-binding Xre family transcriptional regulator
VAPTGSRGRCYDYLKISPKKLAKKIGVFGSKVSKIRQKLNHNIVFEKNAKFCRRKLGS